MPSRRQRIVEDAKLFFAVGAVFGLVAALFGATPSSVAESTEPAAFSARALLIAPIAWGLIAAGLSTLRNLYRSG